MDLKWIYVCSEPVKSTDPVSTKEYEVDGIKCIWTTHELEGISKNMIRFSWRNYIKRVHLTGIAVRVHCYLYSESGEQLARSVLEDYLNEEKFSIYTELHAPQSDQLYLVHFRAWVTPLLKKDYSDMFLQSEHTNLKIKVDRKTMYLNKEFICHHSPVFDKVLNSMPPNLNYWKNEDIAFGDFALLLSIIYPHAVYPEDDDVEKLLEMAKRFKMPAVTRSVEYHLQHFTRLPLETLEDLKNRYGVEYSNTLKCIKFIEVYRVTTKEELIKKHKVDGMRFTCNGIITPTGIRFDFWFKWEMENVNAFDVLIKIRLFDRIHDYKRTKHNRVLYKHPLRGSLFSVFLNMPKKVDRLQVKIKYVLTQYLCVREKYQRLYRSLKDTDRILKVDGKEFRVNMKFLAFHSVYFHKLFFGSVMETKKIIEMHEIHPEALGIFLLSMHSEKELPNDENIECLVCMADYFRVDFLIEQCERYLIHCSKLTIRKKIKLTKQHSLTNLRKSLEQMGIRIPDDDVSDDDDGVQKMVL